MKKRALSQSLGIEPLQCVPANILAVMDLPPVAYSIEYILPKGVHILASDSKIAKSWLVLDVCMAVACGSQLFGYKANEGEVLFLSLDDTLPRLVMRLHDYTQAVELNAGNIYFSLGAFENITTLPFSIEDFIQQHPTTKLIVMDTSGYAKYCTKEITKSSYIETLRKIAHENDISIVIVQDTQNTSSSDKLHWISGGASLSSDVDGVWILEKDKCEDTEGKLTIISNDTPDYSICVKLNASNLTKDDEIR